MSCILLGNTISNSIDITSMLITNNYDIGKIKYICGNKKYIFIYKDDKLTDIIKIINGKLDKKINPITIYKKIDIPVIIKEKKKYSLYKIDNEIEYTSGMYQNGNFDENNIYYYSTISEIIDVLVDNNNYIFMFNNDDNYAFFSDIDNMNNIEEYISKFIYFLSKHYKINIERDVIKVLKNNIKNSYHIVIKKIMCNIKKMKEIHNNFKKIYKFYFYSISYRRNYLNKIISKYDCIDTYFYENLLIRCPNQLKYNNKKHGIYLCEKNNIIDFIIYDTSLSTMCINDTEFIL